MLNQGNYVMFVGLFGHHLMNWAITDQAYDLPRTWYTTFPKRYGFVQVNIGTKHSLENVIIDMTKPEGFSKYIIRYGTNIIGQADNYLSAINYFGLAARDRKWKPRFMRRSKRRYNPLKSKW